MSRRSSRPLTAAELHRKALSQWMTPPYVAEAMWARAKTHNPERVLEPSAGTGHLIAPMDADVQVYACELDAKLAQGYLQAMDPPCAAVYVGDFLQVAFPAPDPGDRFFFDVAVMNPPFEGNRDLAFILRAFELCGIVIVYGRVQLLHRTQCYRELWSRPDVCLSWRADCIPRPRHGGDFNPMDEYVILEIRHGEQTPTIEYARVLNPKLLGA